MCHKAVLSDDLLIVVNACVGRATCFGGASPKCERCSKMPPIYFLGNYTKRNGYHRRKMEVVSPRGVVAKVLNCDLEVSEFELQLRYHVHLKIQKDFKCQC